MKFHHNLILIFSIAPAFPANSECKRVPHTKTLLIAVENDLAIIPVRINGLLGVTARSLQSRVHDLAGGGVQHRQRLLASV
jgi:hypothetical protein